MAPHWESRKDLLVGQSPVELLDAMVALEGNAGWKYVLGMCDRRAGELEGMMSHSIIGSQTVSREHKMDMHNLHASEHETLRSIPRLVEIVKHELNEAVKKTTQTQTQTRRR